MYVPTGFPYKGLYWQTWKWTDTIHLMEYPDLKMAVFDATTIPWRCLYFVYFSFIFLQGKEVVLHS